MAGTYTPAPMPGSPYASQGSINAGNNSGFWGSIANKLSNMGASSYGSGSSGGGGSSTAGNAASGAMQGAQVGSAFGPWGTAAGAVIGGVAGGLSGDEESGQDKYMEEKAQSERETRRFEEKNVAPTSGIGQYLARGFALNQMGMPVLAMLNNFDFMFNKVIPYLGDYGGQLGQNIQKSWNKTGANIGRNISKTVGNVFNWRKR